jgi:excisionase family DNA binding protein
VTDGLGLLTYDEAAAELKCSRSTLKRRIAAGELPVFEDGGLRLIREADLRRYVLERTTRRVAGAAPRVAAAGGSTVRPPGAKLWDS